MAHPACSGQRPHPGGCAPGASRGVEEHALEDGSPGQPGSLAPSGSSNPALALSLRSVCTPADTRPTPNLFSCPCSARSEPVPKHRQRPAQPLPAMFRCPRSLRQRTLAIPARSPRRRLCVPGRSASAVQPYPARPGRDPTREPGRGSATSATTGQPQHRPGRDATIGLGSDVRGPGQPLSEEPIPGERKKCRGPRLACYSCNKCPGFPPRVAFLSCSPASPRTPGPGPLGCAPLSPHRSPAPARGSRAPHL
jgi:hypothetical protein